MGNSDDKKVIKSPEISIPEGENIEEFESCDRRSIQTHLSKLQLERLRTIVNENKERRKKKVDFFYERIFGKKSKVAGFLSGVSNWVLEKVGYVDSEVKLKDLEDEVNQLLSDVSEEGQGDGSERKSFRFEDYVISHRTRGFGDYPDNSVDGLKSALDNGIDPEIDVRVYNGELYAHHDPLGLAKSPPKHAVKIDEMFSAFSEHSKKDSFLNLDIKEFSAVELLINKIDEHGLEKRCRFMSFNPDVLMKIKNRFPKNAMFFHYIPMSEMSNEFTLMFSFLNKSHVLKICDVVDELSNGNTSLRENFEHVSISIDEDYKYSEDVKEDERAFFYSFLPSKSIMDMLVETGGYLSIPLPLASPKLIEAAHNYKPELGGVKVAVWAVENQFQTAQAVSLGADLIISDRPNII